MGFQCGIVGLPNIGKSTLFNALTATAAAEAANYPFCTIEPNIGRVSVPEPRLDILSVLNKSVKITPAQLDFVDIAGLVAGASTGEGLGNQFLANIREVDAIAHVVRCFGGTEVAHDGPLDPISDVEIVETELMLADLESLERRLKPLEKKAKGGDADAIEMKNMIERCMAVLREGIPARDVKRTPDEEPILKQMQLLTAKPMMYVCNVEEESAANGNEYSDRVAEWAVTHGAVSVVISAAIEAEISLLDDEDEKKEFLDSLGLTETGLTRVIRAGYGLLNLITYFTSGPTETRAWTISGNTRAQDAAGVIHTDFARGFISAETIAYDDYVACGGEQAAKEAAKVRKEGRDYIVHDGDVILFRFNV
ncbi:MAG: redox-regulated ATPase YchF [Rhodospirillales bacterium]|nr:redox-regulated ATPase YchF [Rhodospirillales bacterium]